MAKKEKIFLVSNPNTINFEKFAKEKPLSYNYCRLQTDVESPYREDYGKNKLRFISEDKNNIYAQVVNRNKSGRIFNIPKDILKNYSSSYSAKVYVGEELNESVR